MKFKCTMAFDNHENYLSKENNNLDSFVHETTSTFHSLEEKRKFVEHNYLETTKILKESDVAIFGWENEEQSWNKQICQKWIKWGHILRHVNVTDQHKYVSKFMVPLKCFVYGKYRMKLNEVLKNMNGNYVVPYWLAAMVYAKVYLNRNVDMEQFDRKYEGDKNIQNSRGPNVVNNQIPTSTLNYDKRSGKRPLTFLTSSDNKDNEPPNKLICQNIRDLADQIKLETYLKKENEDLNLKIQSLQDELQIMQNTLKNQVGDNIVQINMKNEENITLQLQISKMKEYLQKKNEEIGILQRSIKRQREHLEKEEIAKKDFVQKLKELQNANRENVILQGQISELKEDSRKSEENRKILLSQKVEELKNKHKENFDLQTLNLKLIEDLKRNEEGAKRIMNQKFEELKEKNEENVILHSQISKLKEELCQEAFEKKSLYGQIEELNKINEENRITHLQVPKLKENLQKEELENKVLNKKIKDLTTYNKNIQNDHNQSLLEIQTLNRQIEKIKGKSQLEIKTLKEEIEKIKNEKRLIVQLDESQFDKIASLISQSKVNSRDIAKASLF